MALNKNKIYIISIMAHVRGMGSNLYTTGNQGGGNAKQGLVSTTGRSRSIVFALYRSTVCCSHKQQQK